MSNSEVFSFAQRYMSKGGLSVIPILCDGSKKPSINWQKYQHKKPSIDELIRFFGKNGVGIAAIAGKVSGGLEVLDFDLDAEIVFTQWKEAVTAASAEGVLETIPIQKTPSGGYHLFFRSNSPGANTKLARRAVENGNSKEIRELIETRGEGGYAILTGSPAAVHKSGKTYDLIQGDLTKVPLIDETTRRIFLDEARALNEYFEEYKIPSQLNIQKDIRRPGDDFNNRANWIEVIGPHGWEPAFSKNGEIRWIAPGKHKNETAASSNHFGDDKLMIWSSSVPPFQDGKSYTKFAAITLLEHDGDFISAARTLARKGYGTHNADQEPPVSQIDNQAKEEKITAQLWDISGVEDWPAEPLEWICEGLIPKGGIGFLSGAPKDGKTLLALDLCVHLAHEKPFLDRFATKKTKTLYIAREDPRRRLKERIIEIINSYGFDHVPAGNILFLIRDRFDLMSPEWIKWLKLKVNEHQIDFLILDVLNRMIPELDELSAKDMAEMVSRLEALNRELNLTILCLDHTRKPSGPKSERDNREPNPFDLKGSIAKYGAADFMLCLVRTTQQGRLQLYAENKDTDERPNFLVDVSPKGSNESKFRFAGDVEKFAKDMKAQGDSNRQKVLEAIPLEYTEPKHIYKKLAGIIKPDTIQRHFKKLEKEGFVEGTGKTSSKLWKRNLRMEHEIDHPGDSQPK